MARPEYVIVWPSEPDDHVLALVEVTGTFRSEEEAEKYLKDRPLLRAVGAKIAPITPP